MQLRRNKLHKRSLKMMENQQSTLTQRQLTLKLGKRRKRRKQQKRQIPIIPLIKFHSEYWESGKLMLTLCKQLIHLQLQ
jgi:hypothetical protein